MPKTLGMRWLVMSLSATMLLLFASACTTTETIEVPGETVVVEKIITETVEVPGETVVVEKIVKETVEVPGQTVVVEKEVVKTVEVVKAVPVEVIREVRAGYVTDPTTGKTVTAPRYGGTLTMRSRMLETHVDPWFVHHIFPIEGVLQKMGIADWGSDRNEFNHMSPEPPMFALKGSLAESWETSTDGLTININIREGVNWHDKAPMNGREMTAHDVEYSWHRMRGIPDKYGFTEPAPNKPLSDMAVESITATDNNTLVWKLSEPFFDAERQILLNYGTWVMPREVIEQHGDLRDWKNLVGTGPWMLTDMIFDSIYRLEKTPNYWGFDEKYPENRLPYLDEVRALILSDEAHVAALRTGKVDGATFGASEIALDEAINLSRTNPEIEMWPYARNSFTSFFVNTRNSPFDDVRVRHAMQMALDLDTVNRTMYSGLGVVGPYGLIGEGVAGFYTPFEEWPKELQGYYTYDPEGAEKLLDEAGLPRGSDGIRFKTFLNEPGADSDMDMNIIATKYWAKIGVEVEIKPPADNATWVAIRRDGSYEGLISGGGGRNGNAMGLMYHLLHSKGGYNVSGITDAKFDALYDAAAAATTMEERVRLGREASLHSIWLHSSLWFLKVPFYAVSQPWLVGYGGERSLGPMMRNGHIWARLWIDSELKKAMGY